MNTHIFEQLRQQEFITDAELEIIREKEKKKAFSLHWELKTLLYLGIVLLTTGLGILIYKNIDTIGHQVIVAIIAIGCAACFGYLPKKITWIFSSKKYGH
jgi:membrane-anchored glycerophosphoryl diester phosphodiesterase (GDPDase)